MLIAKITLISVDMSFIIYRKIITFNLKKKKEQRLRGGTRSKYLVARKRNTEKL